MTRQDIITLATKNGAEAVEARMSRPGAVEIRLDCPNENVYLRVRRALEQVRPAGAMFAYSRWYRPPAPTPQGNSFAERMRKRREKRK